MNEIANQIVRALFKKNSLEECSRWELEILADKYPYFGVAQLLVSGKLKEENTAAYEKQVQKTSLYFTNPLWLDYILNKKTPPAHIQEENNLDSKSEAAINTDQWNPAHIETRNTEEEHHQSIENAAVRETPLPIEQAQEENLAAQEGKAALNNDQWNPANIETINTETLHPPIENAAVQETPRVIEQTQEENLAGQEDKAAFNNEQWNPANIETISTEEHHPAIENAAVQETPRAIEQTQEDKAALNNDQWNPANIETISTEEHHPVIENAAVQESPRAIEQTGEENIASQDNTADIKTDQLYTAAQNETMSYGQHQTAPETTAAAETPQVIGHTRDEDSDNISSELSMHERDADPALPGNEPGDQPHDDLSETAIEENAGEFRIKPLNIEPLNIHAPLSFEPYHTIDYFASQGIKLSLEEKPKDKFGQQLKSFTQWLKTIKKVPVSQLGKELETSSDTKVTALAEHSLEDRDVVTETMAEVWAKQGNWGKAIDVYQKLSLQNPSKSSYFASLIEQLKHH